jgi:ubiquinone/menaquinone biosynthesis C-methylase UbiE
MTDPQLDVRRFYDREAQSYDALRWTGPIGRYVATTYERLAFDSIPIQVDGEYLEVGCGTGRFTAPLAEKDVRLTSVDISEEMLESTRRRLTQVGVVDAVTLQQMDARSMEFPDSTFDVIVSMNVLNHVPEYERVVSEMARVLRPGGSIVIGVPSLFSLYWPYGALVNLRGRSLRREVYTRWPSVHALRKQLLAEGIELERRSGMFHCPPLAWQRLWPRP